MAGNITFTFFFILFFQLPFTYGQSAGQNFSKQFSVTSDNDFYLFRHEDGYYTNGLIFKYSIADNNLKKKITKRISDFELGQLIYSQGTRKIQEVAAIDRPITGYLYGKYSQTNFPGSKRFYQLGISIGVIGPGALGKNMQNFFHRQISVNSSYWGWIWDYQLKSEVGLNLHGSYAASLIKKNNAVVQLTPLIQSTLGTSFTNLTTSIFFQLGKINDAVQSNYWSSMIQNKNSSLKAGNEYFFFYHPRIVYQSFNATIEGGLFRREKGPIVASVEPFVIYHEAGFMFSKSRYTFSYSLIHQSKEAKSQKESHAYGSIKLGYRFD